MNCPTYFLLEEESGFIHYLENEIELYFVAKLNQTIVGCAGINFESANIGVLSWGFVYPDYHGKSIRAQLTQHRIQTLKEMGNVQRIVVRISQLTFPFYEKQGFQLVKTQKE